MKFIVKYDKQSLAAAAKSLFVHRWYPMFPGIAITLTIVSLIVGAVTVVANGFGVTSVLFLSLGVLNAIAWISLFTRHRHLIMRRSGEVASMELDDESVRVESDRGNVEIAWNSMIQVDKDNCNVLLFVSRGSALVMPTSSIPNEVMEVVERKRVRLRPSDPPTKSRDSHE